MKTDCMLVKEGEGGGGGSLVLCYTLCGFVASFHLLYYLIYSRL